MKKQREREDGKNKVNQEVRRPGPAVANVFRKSTAVKCDYSLDTVGEHT